MKVLVNTGKRRLGIPGRPSAIILRPGESVPVDDKQIAELENNRTVSKWLHHGTLSIRDADGEPVAPKREPLPGSGLKRVAPERPVRVKNDVREEQTLPEDVKGEGVEISQRGGGWYDVYVNGFKVTDKTVRKDEATDIAARYE